MNKDTPSLIQIINPGVRHDGFDALVLHAETDHALAFVGDLTLRVYAHHGLPENVYAGHDWRMVFEVGDQAGSTRAILGEGDKLSLESWAPLVLWPVAVELCGPANRLRHVVLRLVATSPRLRLVEAG